MSIRVVAALALAGAIAGTGWYVSTLRVEIARLERDLEAQRALRASENATREAQAHRAIETVRRQEREQRDQWERAYVELQGDRDRLAGDLSGAISRLRNTIKRAASTAANSNGVPQTPSCPEGGDGADPYGLLRATGEDILSIGRAADTNAVRARENQAWIRAVVTDDGH